MRISVLMVTYNHEDFIAEAMDSVLMQRVDCPYEMVVGEDCSTDATKDLLLAYQQKYASLIRVVSSCPNQGLAGNFARTLRACRGEYVAILEGDDYWTSPDKLAKQCAFLVEHPECSMCFHRKLTIPGNWPSPTYPLTTMDIEDLLAGGFRVPGLSTTMFRRSALGGPPEWLNSAFFVEWPLYVLAGEQGSFGFIDEVMSTYRLHGGGMWTSLSLAEKASHNIHDLTKMLDAYKGLDTPASQRRRAFVQIVIARWRQWLQSVTC